MNFALHLQTIACSPDADEGYARTTCCSTRRAQKVPGSEQFSAGGKQMRPRENGCVVAPPSLFVRFVRVSLIAFGNTEMGGALLNEKWEA